MNLWAAINHGLHLASVVFWIGGLAFQICIMAPFLKSDRPPQDYLITLSNRFQKCVGPILMILLVTGGMNIGLRRAGQELPPGYISMLGIKVILVAAIASLHFFDMLRPPQDSLSASSPRLPRKTLPVVFVLGLIIIFIASLLRHWQT